MHKTLKAETAHPPAATLAGQQQRFAQFRAEFNHQRPHQALGQAVPAAVYTPAPRPYPAGSQTLLTPVTANYAGSAATARLNGRAN